MTIRGQGANLLGIDAHLASRVFNVDDASALTNLRVSIIGLTLANGRSTGGGIITNNENLTLDSVEVTGGATTAGNGGGVLNTSSLVVLRSTFSDNQSAADGGAIASSGGLSVQKSTLVGNRAVGSGSAVSSTAIAPPAPGLAGEILFSTIVSNRADLDNNGTGGRAINIAGPGAYSLTNSIVAGNTTTNGAAEDIGTSVVPLTGSNNVIADAATSGPFANGVNGNIVGNNGAGTIPLTAILNPTLGLNGAHVRTLALVQNSPALGRADANSPFFGFKYDQRQVAYDFSAPDIGAYEAQHPLTPVGAPSEYSRTFLPKPSASANEAFVKGLYQSTLYRDPDAAGLAGWVAILSGGANRIDVAYNFVNSVENRTNQVSFFYQYFLGRAPDAVGLAGWVHALQTGTDEATVMRGFILSPEFTGQNDNASFVNLMYFSILGRAADPASFNSWVNQLNSGQSTRGQVADGFVLSVESITRVVQSDFASYLKRTIQPEEAAPYVTLIQSGTTFGRIAANLVGSDEFFAAASQNLT